MENFLETVKQDPEFAGDSSARDGLETTEEETEVPADLIADVFSFSPPGAAAGITGPAQNNTNQIKDRKVSKTPRKFKAGFGVTRPGAAEERTVATELLASLSGRGRAAKAVESAGENNRLPRPLLHPLPRPLLHPLPNPPFSIRAGHDRYDNKCDGMVMRIALVAGYHV